MTVPTGAEIADALAENRAAPAGPARSARAEQLVELAAGTDDRPLTIRALQELIRAYEYSGEQDKILVPFARVIRMWDENPADFDRAATYYLHWHFKWVTSGMLAHPNVPLASINRWLDEMAVRYRQVGHGMHAVHANRHYVAEHVGDVPAAARAFDDWLAAERDQMSDCHACDRSNQGDWYVATGKDAEALEVWQPVLAGELWCDEEPHRALAKSLLPLVRLGRHGDARGNHLRGYRMARGNPSLRATVGRHLEFAALTGNEPRGLEILAEHAAWLTADVENARDRLSLLEAVVVLFRRLDMLGHPDLVIATPGAQAPTATVGELLPRLERETAELAARFDERNGTTAISDRSRERMRRERFEGTLILGVKDNAPALQPPAPQQAAPPAGAPEPRRLDELVADAVALSARHHPDAAAAWERVAASGAELDPHVAASIAESRAFELRGDRSEAARAAFLDVAERYAGCGDAPLARVNRARAALAATLAGDAATGRRELAEALREIDHLHAAGQAELRHLLAVRVIHAREAFYRWLSGGAPEPASPDYADLLTSLHETMSAAEAAGERFHRGSAAVLLAQARLAAGVHDDGQRLLTGAVEDFLAAGAPWQTAMPLETLAELALAHDDPAGAEEHLHAALRHGGTLLEPAELGHLTHLLARVRWHQGGRDEEVIDQALAAAQRLDPHDPVEAAKARLLAAYGFERLGKPAEAAALIEAALPDLEQHGDPVEFANAKRSYGQCLQRLGEPHAAAQALLGAATLVQDWPDQTAHASLAHEAGTALEAAGLIEEAERAYGRATELWRDLGQPGMRVRALRARAWLALKRPEPDWPGALGLMESASELVAATGDGAATAEDLAFERSETLLQTAQLLLDWPAEVAGADAAAQRGLASADSAAAGFTALGEPGRAAHAHFVAAELETGPLGRPGAAITRLRELRQAGRHRGDPVIVETCDRYLARLDPEHPRGDRR